MGLNLIILLLIVLITLYLATQGMLSSLIALVTATFSSILAMALMEPLQGIIAGWRPDYARGLTFLTLFFLIFAATRVVADIAVPDNIKVSLWINRGAGAFLGFFTALVVVGSIVIGLEMLPLPRVLLGFNRFPGDSVMQGDAPGEVSRRRSSVTFAPDRFVLAIWNGVSGRALGGNLPWSSIHPDLSVESYGYRNSVAKGSLRVVPKDLFKATDVWVTTELPGIKADPGKHLVTVRTVVTKGDKPPHDGTDEDSYFRISATQVRLMTNKDRQYYPSGHLERGTKFEALPLDSGYLVEDYVRNQVIEDWVFQTNEDERPTLIEMKQLGREGLPGLAKDQAFTALSPRDYPQHPYLKDLCTLDAQFDTKGKTILEANVYVLPPTTFKRNVASEINTAFSNVERISSSISNGSGGWSTTERPGVPTRNQIAQAYNAGTQNLKNAAPDDELRWQTVLQLLLVGKAEPDGERNLENYPKYISGDLMSVLTVLSTSQVDIASGKATLEKINPGSKVVLATLRTDRAFYVWVQEKDFKPATHLSETFGVAGGGEAPMLIIDLDAK